MMCSTTASEAASQAITGSKLVSAMEKAVRSTLPESAAPAAKLDAKTMTTIARANVTAAPADRKMAASRSDDRAIILSFENSSMETRHGQRRRSNSPRQDLQRQLRKKTAA